MKNLGLALLVTLALIGVFSLYAAFIQWVIDTNNDWMLAVLGFAVLFGFIYHGINQCRR